ncbi:MAG: polysaccharide biosynthesis tyrosine autokinase [Candidatus Coproplasma sp.]
MENNENGEKTINLGSIFKYLWKNIILFSAVFVGVLVIGLVYVFAIVKPTYKSSATFVVAVRQESDNSNSTNNNIDYVNSFRIIETVANLVTEDIVLGEVAKDNGMSKGALAGMTTVSYGEMNYLISVSVEHEDKEKSKDLANALVSKLLWVTSSTEGLEFLSGTVTQTSEADLGTYASPNKTMGALVSIVAGVGVACVVVAIKYFASKKFRNREEIEERLSGRVLGYFPNNKEKEKQSKGKKEVYVGEKAELVKSNIKNYEPYNALLNNIKYSNIENPVKAIMLTSSNEDEMKSTIACNLSACIAYNGQKVVILDLDMRKPVVHKVFKVSCENGIVELLNSECELSDVIKHTEYGVDIITSGKKILNPMAVIGHKSLPELIKKLKEMYDYVIIDTPPVLACTDAVALAPLCDGVLFNVAMLDVKKKMAEDAINALRAGGANVIGLNVTKGTETKIDSGYYYSNNYYNNYYTKSETVAEVAVTDESKS